MAGTGGGVLTDVGLEREGTDARGVFDGSNGRAHGSAVRGRCYPPARAWFRHAPALVGAVLGIVGCGGGSGGSLPSATGSLTVTGCTIAEGASACTGSVAWVAAGAGAPRVVFRGATLGTGAAGQVSVTLSDRLETVALFDGEAKLDEQSLRGQCVTASAWDGGVCRAYARRLDERAPTPFVEQGRPVFLEVVVFEPLTPGPHPTVVFHHGSTGNGSDPALFTLTYTNEGVAQFFVSRGFQVAFPQRRGRGKSDGVYDEGFNPERSAYSCFQGPALAGFERALLDVEVAVGYVRSRARTDASRLLSAGVSRGGVLALAHAGLRQGLFEGAVNFVGGWLGEGCGDAVVVNRSAFARGATFDRPTLWLYAENDSFYSLAHSRGNYDTFRTAGGLGTFFTYTRASGLNGHFVINDPSLWTADLDAYLRAVEN